MMLLHIGLFLHMVGLFLAGAGSFGSFIVEGQLWKRVEAQKEDAIVLLPVIKKITSVVYAGMITFIVSGLLMLYSVQWVFLSNPWFLAKLFLFLMLPVRGALIGKNTFQQIGLQVSQNLNNPGLPKLKAKMRRFHFIQYTIVALILFLIIFKV